MLSFFSSFGNLETEAQESDFLNLVVNAYVIVHIIYQEERR